MLSFSKEMPEQDAQAVMDLRSPRGCLLGGLDTVITSRHQRLEGLVEIAVELGHLSLELGNFGPTFESTTGAVTLSKSRRLKSSPMRPPPMHRAVCPPGGRNGGGD
jgi:hypothetical protein